MKAQEEAVVSARKEADFTMNGYKGSRKINIYFSSSIFEASAA
jgi:hypothetical protein